MKIMKNSIILVLAIVLAAPLYAETEKRTAKILEIEGTVQIKPAGQKWVPAEADMVLHEGDMILTEKDSRALVNVDGEGETATVTVNGDSQLLLTELIKIKESGVHRTFFELALGKILIKAKKLHTEDERFEVKTPTTIVGVRGTVFEIEVGTEE